MTNVIARFVRDDQGQDLIEYALLCAGLVLALLTAVQGLRTAIATEYGDIGTEVGALGN